MKAFMDFEEHIAMKEKRSKKMKGKRKQNYGNDPIESMMRKKKNSKKTRAKKFKDNKRYLYDYEEDFYDIDEFK